MVERADRGWRIDEAAISPLLVPQPPRRVCWSREFVAQRVEPKIGHMLGADERGFEQVHVRVLPPGQAGRQAFREAARGVAQTRFDEG